MQIYSEQLNAAIIPRDILINQEKIGLTNDELVGLIKLLTIKDEEDNLLNYLNKHNINREIISSLEKKQIIELRNQNGKIEVKYIYLNSPYEKQVEQQETNQVLINREMIDRLNFLLNRQLKSHELEKIKSWLNLEYSMQEIEEAINKSILNGADNFNYIEKVLFNNYGSKQQKNIKIERNFELY